MRRFTLRQVHALAKIVERFERAAVLAGFDDGIRRRLRPRSDRAQAEADALAVGRRKSRPLEFTSGGSTGMPISRHSLMYFTTLAVLPVSDVSSAAKKSTRVVRLQIRRDEGQIGVGGRVRLVEAVAGELLHQIENLLDLLLRDGRAPRRL